MFYFCELYHEIIK